MVGLLIFGVALGPHVLGFFGEHRPIADFFGELGILLLMFSAGLEIDIALFRRAQTRSIIFGLFPATLPLLFGTLVGLGFGYALIPAIVVGSLLSPGGEMDGCGGCGARLRLLAGSKIDDVGAHPAAGGCHARGCARRV